MPQSLTLGFEKVQDLAYGENPHQRAAYYRELGARRAPPLAGRAAPRPGALVRQPLRPRRRAAPAPRVHAADVRDRQARERVRRRDGGDDRGGVRACARLRPAVRVRDGLRRQPSRERRAREADRGAVRRRPPRARLRARARSRRWRTKPGTRILVNRERRAFQAGELDYKRVPGGLLVQDRDRDVEERDSMTVVAGSPTEEQWGDLLFAWRICKHVWSNAIVIAKDLQTLGIGAGQQSRVDAVKIALDKAQTFGHDLEGSVLASDAFFPFADGPELALASGVAAIIQPGGSKRDAEVVAAVRASRRRYGLHRAAGTSGTDAQGTRHDRTRSERKWLDSRRRRRGVLHDDPRRRDRQRRDPVDPEGPRHRGVDGAVGDHRLRDHVRRIPAARRPDGRPDRPASDLPRRPRAVHARVARRAASRRAPAC